MKCGAETSLLAYEWDAQKKMFMPLDKVAIPRTKFTLTVAVDTIIKMDAIHHFDWIYVDRGFGRLQFLVNYSTLNLKRTRGAYYGSSRVV